MLKFEAVKLKFPEGCNIILGQSHFIKTIEDIYEALINSVPGIEFGLAFSESSGSCLVRCDGTDVELKEDAAQNVLRVGSGHCFLIILRNAYPINVLNSVKEVREVCSIFCATANPVEVVIAESKEGRGILGVIDGLKPAGIESDTDISWRKGFLRKIGYKLSDTTT